MRLGVMILPDRRWKVAGARWATAEAWGFDSAWTYDHLWWRTLQDGPWFASVPVLAAAAATTRRIGLGMLVASPNFRHPVLLAKEAIALDDVSEGRFTLGVGVGSAGAGDAQALGGPALTASERSARFGEFVALTSRLLRSDRVSHEGSHYSAREIRTTPGALRPSGIPLAVAATRRAGLDLVATHARSWVTCGPADFTSTMTTDECLTITRHQIEDLARACDRVGRDPEEIERVFVVTGVAGDPLRSVPDCLRMAEEYSKIGITEMVIHWPRIEGLFAGSLDVLHQVAIEALPQIRGL